MNISLEWHEELTSTAEVFCARARAEYVPEGTLLLAGRQTAGRGRGSVEEKPFYSPVGGCYMSLLLRGVCPTEALPLTSRTALAARRVLVRYGCEAGVKWVNDLFYSAPREYHPPSGVPGERHGFRALPVYAVDGYKKIAGILVQRPAGGMGEGCTVVSCGINLYPNPEDSPPEALREIIAWCFRDAAEAPDIKAFALELAEEIAEVSAEQNNAALLEEYRAASIVLGRNIAYEQNGRSFSATALDITPAGGLLIRRDDGCETVLTSGSIVLLH